MTAGRTAPDGSTVEPAVPWGYKTSRRPEREAKLPCAQPYARVRAKRRTEHLPTARLSSSRLVRLLHLHALQTIKRHHVGRPSAPRDVDRCVTAEPGRKRVDARDKPQRKLKPVLESPCSTMLRPVRLGLVGSSSREASAASQSGTRSRMFRGKAGPRRERGCARRRERGPTWTDS